MSPARGQYMAMFALGYFRRPRFTVANFCHFWPTLSLGRASTTSNQDPFLARVGWPGLSILIENPLTDYTR